MNGEKLTPITNKPSLWALSPLLVFLCLYLVTSIIVNDFYKVPITIAFMVSSVYAVCITKGLSLNERMLQYSIGAANKNIMLMIWIFILAGAFAQSAKDIGAIDATVNLTLLLLPDNLLLAGIFLAACFISLSIGTSVGTIVALVPVAAGIAEKTDKSRSTPASMHWVATTIHRAASRCLRLISATVASRCAGQRSVVRRKILLSAPSLSCRSSKSLRAWRRKLTIQHAFFSKHICSAICASGTS